MCLILMYLLILVSQNPVVKVGIFIKFSKVTISLLSRFRKLSAWVKKFVPETRIFSSLINER